MVPVDAAGGQSGGGGADARRGGRGAVEVPPVSRLYSNAGSMAGGRGENLGMAELITVTETAASKIAALMAEENKESAGLRVFVQGGGCSGFQYGLMIEEGSGDASADKVFESNGINLYVDPISIRYLSGAEVDFVDNLTGGGFTIRNPNAKSTCGCGSSFNV